MKIEQPETQYGHLEAESIFHPLTFFPVSVYLLNCPFQDPSNSTFFFCPIWRDMTLPKKQKLHKLSMDLSGTPSEWAILDIWQVLKAGLPGARPTRDLAQ